MSRATGHVHAAVPDFNDDQHRQPLDPDLSMLQKATAFTL